MASTTIELVTFRLPLGTTGRMDEPQTRMLIDSLEKYRVAIRRTSQVESVRRHLRNGEKLLMYHSGAWYPFTASVQEVGERETITITHG